MNPSNTIDTTRPPNTTKQRAGDRVYSILKEEILTGKIEPGALLSENEISRRFEISRTPVREALNHLACDGLLRVMPQRGHLVRTISFSEVLEAFRLRELLEVEAAGEAARFITDEEIEELKNIIQNPADGAMMNYVFHSTIARISRNRLLAEFIEELLTLMQRMIVNHPRLLDLTAEMRIIEALETRNPDAARDAMRAHTYEARDSLLNGYSDR